MRAIFVNEFERGLKPDQSLDVGKKRFERDPEAHIEDLETHPTEDDEMREEIMGQYVFISKSAFKPVTVKGKKYHEEVLEIENLYQVDLFDKADRTAVAMMQLRAQMSGDGSKVYKIEIPRWMHDEKTAYDSEISDELREFIEENKKELYDKS